MGHGGMKTVQEQLEAECARPHSGGMLTNLIAPVGVTNGEVRLRPISRRCMSSLFAMKLDFPCCFPKIVAWTRCAAVDRPPRKKPGPQSTLNHDGETGNRFFRLRACDKFVVEGELRFRRREGFYQISRLYN
jgi:hypothetical protein